VPLGILNQEAQSRIIGPLKMLLCPDQKLETATLLVVVKKDMLLGDILSLAG
jgi:hypothetical protein